jgi:hypothetical protein
MSSIWTPKRELMVVALVAVALVVTDSMAVLVVPDAAVE